jgi:hypothetical protein
MLKWAVAASAAVLVAAVILAYTEPGMREVHRQHQAFNAAFQQYSSAILARDYPAAYSLGGREFRAVLSQSDFAKEQQELESRLGILESASVAKLEIRGSGDPAQWIAKVQELRHYKNGNLYLRYEFRFEDGQWRLFGYQEDE